MPFPSKHKVSNKGDEQFTCCALHSSPCLKAQSGCRGIMVMVMLNKDKISFKYLVCNIFLLGINRKHYARINLTKSDSTAAALRTLNKYSAWVAYITRSAFFQLGPLPQSCCSASSFNLYYPSHSVRLRISQGAGFQTYNILIQMFQNFVLFYKHYWICLFCKTES